jgi:phosphoglycerate dehydrogenase-like enzyme
MQVLISIQQRVPQWQIPEAAARSIVERFPDVRFSYATTDEERAHGLEKADAAYTWILNAAELARAPRLQWVHSSAVAVETLCLTELFARGIRVSNTRGVQAVPIAEHVLAVLFACAKQIPFTLANQQQARWAQHEYVGARLPWLMKGRTLGLIGVGTIGAALASRADALGMRVVALRRRADAADVPGVTRVYARDELNTMLGTCDAVVIAAPLTPDTEGLIGRDAIARMKPGAILINVGRARILDTAALVDALHAGHLSGASLDVFPEEPLPSDHPLWSCPNVILTPHTSGFRQGHWDEVVDVFADNLERYRRGEPLRYEVKPEWGY